MADNTPNPAGATPVIDPVAHNKDIAQKQAAQDISGKSTVTGEFGDASAALDKLAADVKVTPAADTPLIEPVSPETPAPDSKVTPPTPTSAPEPDTSVVKAEEVFKDVPQLPPGVSPKSAEAFAMVKTKAIQEIAAREERIAKLEAQLSQTEEKLKTPSEEQIQKERELEEHRLWRSKMDVEFDPKFKSYDKNISETRDFIYSQLQKSPAVTPELIEQIKKYGGPDQTNMTKLFEAINDPVIQRVVESKVAEIEMSKYQKEKAINEAKANVSNYLTERKQQFEQATTMHTRATTENLSPLLNQLDWFKDKPLDGDEAAKAAAKDHNTFLSSLRQQIDAAIRDDSPNMRAILIAGMAQLFNLQRHHAGVKAELESAKKSLAEITAKWNGIRQASRTRLEESAAPSAGKTTPKSSEQFNMKAGDALDAIGKQIMEERSRANTGA